MANLDRRLTGLEAGAVIPLPAAPIAVQTPADVVGLVEATWHASTARGATPRCTGWG